MGDAQALVACLGALKNSQDGQIKLNEGAFNESLVFLLQAHKSFKMIPSARYLLGITCADIAAAHANLGHCNEAAEFARDAILIVQGNQIFAKTEANAHMTLANQLAALGKPDEAEVHYGCARETYRRIPDGSQYLQALEHNRAIMLPKATNKKPWWKPS